MGCVDGYTGAFYVCSFSRVNVGDKLQDFETSGRWVPYCCVKIAAFFQGFVVLHVGLVFVRRKLLERESGMSSGVLKVSRA